MGFTNHAATLQPSNLSTPMKDLREEPGWGTSPVGSTHKPTLDQRPQLPCSRPVTLRGKSNPVSEQTHFSWGQGESHHGFCSSECLSLKRVLSVGGKSPACPTSPFSITSVGRCCACTLPHLCTGIGTAAAGSHSLLGSLPLATACRLGQLEIRGVKRCLWVFPQVIKPFPPLGACRAQCYSSELALLF